LRKIEESEAANSAGSADKETEAMIAQFRRDKKEVEAMIVELNGELNAANEKLATTKSERTTEKQTKIKNDLEEQIGQLNGEKSYFEEAINEFDNNAKNAGDQAYNEAFNQLAGKTAEVGAKQTAVDNANARAL
jgi:hypothetical protein